MTRRATSTSGPPPERSPHDAPISARDTTGETAAPASEDAAPAALLLEEPADGIPPVIETERDLEHAAQRIAEGTGPIAIDAERASGYRYGNRAYLVQLRREGSGSWLIDPIACPDLTPIHDAIGSAEWVLHAATQDLPCLAEVGMRPTALFDTELGARLAGLPRVGLAAVVEHYLGLSLAKEHSAVDWSTRPLPEPWLRYAALDVEVLVEVRDRMYADLESQGKLAAAQQEFASLTTFTGPPQRTDPWRRTSGKHTLRDRRALARVRALWEARDDIARARDTAPGRVLPDALLVQIAAADPRTNDDLDAATNTPASASSRSGRQRPPHRSVARYRQQWLGAVRDADRLAPADLPAATVRSDAPPPPRAWADREPVAAARLVQVREALADVSEQRTIPVENLITPDFVRRVLWTPPAPGDEAAFRVALEALGARPWQIDTAAPLLAQAVLDHPDED